MRPIAIEVAHNHSTGCTWCEDQRNTNRRGQRLRLFPNAAKTQLVFLAARFLAEGPVNTNQQITLVVFVTIS
jgi:hypothetical protein